MSHTQVSSDIMCALKCVNLSTREQRVLFAIFDYTLKWHREFDVIKNVDIARETNIDSSNVAKAKKSLLARKILISHRNSIGVNPNTAEWLEKSGEKLSVPTVDKKALQSEPTASYSQNQPQKTVETNPPLIKKETNNNKKLINHANSKIQTLEKFEITDELKAWADENKISHFVDLQASTKKFIERHKADKTCLSDWAKAWKGWVQNAKKFAMRSQKKSGYVAKKPRVEMPVGTYSKYSTPASEIAADFAPFVEKAKRAQRSTVFTSH